jgi:DNA-binding MarR family transcriptional regulator
VTSPIKRRRSDRLYPRTLRPRELEALRLIEQRPGITAAELADRLGVTTNRVWQIVRRLELGQVRRER